MRTRTFQKILIANRGEIAVRVMRTCRAMGIASVAVYSDADQASPHVRSADEAVHIGPSPSAESYLRIEKIIEAARRTGAEAIHPGYGFLSENADFAAACAQSGLVFIGPAEEAIRNMGLKSTARRIMAEAGIPIVPGYDGEEQSLESLCGGAINIGWPVLIKASAGGGGRGMRVVRDLAELEAAIEGARREAEKAFGDGTLLLEKFIDRARHIEFQILGDAHGHLVHLFERECSVQRRHQKIIEESPSPALTPELRARMGQAAVEVGRAIGYVNAGTVEFILTPAGDFYFIEVNTRLQVEHPVTELVTGLDLVKLQIEIAEGGALPFTEVRPTGHAVEARLYAEDPGNGFLPATGAIYDWNPPPSIEGLRIDAGIDSRMEVGIYYDPLLAKLIAHGADREAAVRKLAYALRNLSVQGVQTNREFLIRLLEHPAFRRGEAHTGFVSEHLGELVAEQDAAEDFTAAAVVALYLQKSWEAERRTLPHVPLNYRNNPFRDPSIKLQVGETEFQISYRQLGSGSYLVSAGNSQATARVVAFQPGSIRLAIDSVQRLFRVTEAGERFFAHSSSGSRVVARLARYPYHQVESNLENASAPMPGQVLRILVVAGQAVAVGDPLVILEAMKMEHTLRAAMDGVVEAILVKIGDVVAPGDVLVHIGAM